MNSYALNISSNCYGELDVSVEDVNLFVPIALSDSSRLLRSLMVPIEVVGMAHVDNDDNDYYVVIRFKRKTQISLYLDVEGSSPIPMFMDSVRTVSLPAHDVDNAERVCNRISRILQDHRNMREREAIGGGKILMLQGTGRVNTSIIVGKLPMPVLYPDRVIVPADSVEGFEVDMERLQVGLLLNTSHEVLVYEEGRDAPVVDIRRVLRFGVASGDIAESLHEFLDERYEEHDDLYTYYDPVRIL